MTDPRTLSRLFGLLAVFGLAVAIAALAFRHWTDACVGVAYAAIGLYGARVNVTRARADRARRRARRIAASRRDW